MSATSGDSQIVRDRMAADQRRHAEERRAFGEENLALATKVRAAVADLTNPDRFRNVEDLLRSQNAAWALMLPVMFRQQLKDADAYEADRDRDHGRR